MRLPPASLRLKLTLGYALVFILASVLGATLIYLVASSQLTRSLDATLEETAAVAKDFKLFYKKVPGKTEGTYTLDHSAGSYVYDTAGRLRVYERYGGGPQVLGADVKALLQEKRS